MTDRMVELVVLPNEAIAAGICDALEHAGIAAEYSPAHDRVPAFGVSVGTPVRIKVSAGRVEEAARAIDEAREAGELVDWDNVDLGEPEDADAAAIAGRAHVSDDELQHAEQLRKAKQLRSYGVSLIAIAVGFVFAFFGRPVVLYMILAVVAVWLGRKHAINRRRRQIERLMHNEQSE